MLKEALYCTHVTFSDVYAGSRECAAASAVTAAPERSGTSEELSA